MGSLLNYWRYIMETPQGGIIMITKHRPKANGPRSIANLNSNIAPEVAANWRELTMVPAQGLRDDGFATSLHPQCGSSGLPAEDNSLGIERERLEAKALYKIGQ